MVDNGRHVKGASFTFVQCNLIFSVVFGMVERVIKMTVEALEISVGGKFSYADTQGNSSAVGKRRSFCGGILYALGDGFCRFKASSRKNDEKFLAAPASYTVRRPDIFFEYLWLYP